MKTKITRKEVMNTHQHVLKVGYCQLQTLLKFRDAYAYTSNGEGWCSDVYSIGTIAISTGRRPFGNINISYDLANKYEELAKSEKARYNEHLDNERFEKNLVCLIDSFINEAIVTDGKGYENVKVKEHFQFN